jgi:glycosyltransferase involved in cell wall biosynthesis
MLKPLISIAIATYNSGNTLEETLQSIKKQQYPKNRIEILVIDGGSTDKTVSIAKRYHAKIISNPKTELIFAKHIAFFKAKGKYLLYLDSDESLFSSKSLALKLSAFEKNNNIKAVILAGYKTPKQSSQLNFYINDFGDPFSFFVYRESKGEDYLFKEWKTRFKKSLISNNDDVLIFNFSKIKYLPAIELWAGGNMIDLQYAKKKFPQIKNDPSKIALLFFLLTKDNKFIAASRNDFTVHNSTPNIAKYLKKISSRVKNNVFFTAMGRGGFKGREQFQPKSFLFMKYLFLPYSFSLIFPCLDGLYLAFSRKKTIYLLHPLLCLYTAWLILYYSIIKLLRIPIAINYYGS